jgi:hypothetical protein
VDGAPADGVGPILPPGIDLAAIRVGRGVVESARVTDLGPGLGPTEAQQPASH